MQQVTESLCLIGTSVPKLQTRLTLTSCLLNWLQFLAKENWLISGLDSGVLYVIFKSIPRPSSVKNIVSQQVYD